jgi:hypothetical protein
MSDAMEDGGHPGILGWLCFQHWRDRGRADLPPWQANASRRQMQSARGPKVNTPKYLISIIRVIVQGHELGTERLYRELGPCLRLRFTHGVRDVDLHRPGR